MTKSMWNSSTENWIQQCPSGSLALFCATLDYEVECFCVTTTTPHISEIQLEGVRCIVVTLKLKMRFILFLETNPILPRTESEQFPNEWITRIAFAFAQTHRHIYNQFRSTMNGSDRRRVNNRNSCVVELYSKICVCVGDFENIIYNPYEIETDKPVSQTRAGWFNEYGLQ